MSRRNVEKSFVAMKTKKAELDARTDAFQLDKCKILISHSIAELAKERGRP